MDLRQIVPTDVREVSSVEVSVYCHGFLLGRGLLCDLGTLGLRVEWVGMIPSRHLYLEVEFSLKTLGGDKEFRLPVYLGDSTEGKLELLYVDCEEKRTVRLCATLAKLDWVSSTSLGV